jgi:predicted ATP-dependent endonuclease of OLD family
MQLVSAKIGPYRSLNSTQALSIDPEVTVLVGMNEAGKTVLLKAMHKAADALGQESFDPIEDYPRKDLSAYLKNHASSPAVALTLEYAISEENAKEINAVVGTSLKAGHKLTVSHDYKGGESIAIEIDEAALVKTIAKSLSTDASAAIKDCKSVREIADAVSSVSLTEGDQTIIAQVKARIDASKWEDVARWEAWSNLRKSAPKFLYFSDYDLLPGKMNLSDLSQRVEKSKADQKLLHSSHRSVLALLRMADVSLDDISKPGSYEELKAKIEAVSISLTDQVMEFWKQNEDLEVEVDIKADPSDEAPFNNGPNLYLRIRNRRHRGVSTPFDQRSRGFIWFFSFLVWFDSVQHQIDTSGKNVGKKLILLLDEPGLALHALAQSDFLRYIDTLAREHQVIYTTHSPFMVHSDRLHQVRLVEDQKKVGTVVSENLNGADERTIFPLQAALGWTIAQNLFISKRNLLVEGPSELTYLQVASSFLDATGAGLRNDITIVPAGGLDNLATFIALLGASDLKLAVLHDFRGSPEQKLENLVREKLLSPKALFNVAQFRGKASTLLPSDIEDLFDVTEYLAMFNATFAAQLAGQTIAEPDLPAGDRVVQRIEQRLKAKGISLRPSGGFNHYLVAKTFAVSPPKSLSAATLARFTALFQAVNAAV